MATGTLLPNGEQTFLDNNGVPLAGGSVYMYIPTTSTFKNTWQDSAETILNTNPIILDAAGRAIIYGTGSYRQLVKDSLGNTIWDQLTADTSTSITGLTGQCKLLYTNSTTLTLKPWNGNNLVINNVSQKVPSAGITLSNSGLTNALTYVYAYMNGATMTLTSSTTAYVTDSTSGVMVLSGDPTRSLVGMCYPDSGVLFNDSSALRLVRSWFNEGSISGANNINAQSDSVTAVAPNYAELAVSAATFKANFLLWSNERVFSTYNWDAGTAGGAAVVHTFIGVNLTGAYTGSGSLPSYGVSDCIVTSSAANGSATTDFGASGGTQNGGGTQTEGLNNLTMYAAVDAGNAAFAGNRGQTRISYITGRR